MTIPPLFELGSVTVVDSGVAGKERIIFRPTEELRLAQYGLLIGWRDTDGITTPADNFYFWLGDAVITPPCWLVIYTGKGEYREDTHNGHPVYYYYWGRESTVFNVADVIPLVFKIAGMQFGGHMKPPPFFKDVQKSIAAKS